MYYFYDEKTDCVACEPDNVDECLEMIFDLGADYDGFYGDAKGLETLVDELVIYAQKARQYLEGGRLYSNAAEEVWYHQEAIRKKIEHNKNKT